jgi:hypothetical protein
MFARGIAAFEAPHRNCYTNNGMSESNRYSSRLGNGDDNADHQ